MKGKSKEKTMDKIVAALCFLSGALLLAAGLAGRNITYMALGCFVAALGVLRLHGGARG